MYSSVPVHTHKPHRGQKVNATYIVIIVRVGLIERFYNCNLLSKCKIVKMSLVLGMTSLSLYKSDVSHYKSDVSLYKSDVSLYKSDVSLYK